MKGVAIILLMISINSFPQSDSIKLTIVKVRSVENKVYYFLKGNGNRYITECSCKRKKGEWVLVAKKDLKIVKETFTKQDL